MAPLLALLPFTHAIPASLKVHTQQRCEAAEIGCYEALGRHRFRTVAFSQSYDTFALITKIIKRLHVNVAQNPSPWDPFKDGHAPPYWHYISSSCSDICYDWLSMQFRFSLLLSSFLVHRSLEEMIFRYLISYCEDSISVCYILNSCLESLSSWRELEASPMEESVLGGRRSCETSMWTWTLVTSFLSLMKIQ